MTNRILGNHPTILPLNELHYFGADWFPTVPSQHLDPSEVKRLIAILLARQEHGVWGRGPSRRHWERAGKILRGIPESSLNGAGAFDATVTDLADEAGATIVSEHTPRNIFYAHQLLSLYPESKIVSLIRDPRAVLASQKNRWKRKWLGGSNIPWSEVIRVWANYHPLTVASLWERAANASLDVADQPRVFLLRFENLMTDPENTVRSLCEFVGIEYLPNMLEVPQAGSSNAINKSRRRGVDKAASVRWHQVISKGEQSLMEFRLRKTMPIFEYESAGGAIPVGALAFQLMTFPLHALMVLAVNPKRALIQLRALLLRRFRRLL